MYSLDARVFAERFGPGEYGDDWDEVPGHASFDERNPLNPERVHAGTWRVFAADVATRGVLRPVEVDPYDSRVCEGHHRVCAALLADVPIPFTVRAYRPGHPLAGTRLDPGLLDGADVDPSRSPLATDRPLTPRDGSSPVRSLEPGAPA